MAELKLDDGTIEECVVICERMLDKLEQAKLRTIDLRNTGGFGTLPSAEQLAAGYSRKADDVLETVLRYISAVEAMRDAFRAGGLAYAESDSAVSAALRTVGGPVS
ncbi:hypothetical protein DW322_20765 [Rhodococcus rhodnii]|uniref:PE domain-containing protein n=2 Tax=Rhodococcus rhodnii TaxID=38312 RepID=R7WRD6_9NOCA|nr:hypothetical protein [Rhodococcus rhodnii]EOM76544.1 hypothetical protein Rrhod_2084 [Rhodococcus rhodnii LMG 5362]TXG92158.1 hypothetical protein DW322_20765 [Rhodococcus rhodnii]